MKTTLHSLYILSMLLLMLLFMNNNTCYAQQKLSCTINGDKFNGKIESAAKVKFGSENLIQIKSVDDDKILYLYIKSSKLSDKLPLTLNFKDHDPTKGELADAEVVWAPDGPDNPQWNSVDGKLVVTYYDSINKVISGNFDFIVEKFVYGTKAEEKRPSEEIKEGKFESIDYKVDE